MSPQTPSAAAALCVFQILFDQHLPFPPMNSRPGVLMKHAMKCRNNIQNNDTLQ
jgi:hypothetical protein